MTISLTKDQKQRLIQRFKHQQHHRLQTHLSTLSAKSQTQHERTIRRKLLIPTRFRTLKISEIVGIEREKKVKLWEVMTDVLKKREEMKQQQQQRQQVSKVENQTSDVALKGKNLEETEEMKRMRRIEEIKKLRQGNKKNCNT